MKCPISLLEAICADFRPFSDSDWDGFAGAEGANPQIADVKDYQVILDDNEEGTAILGVYDCNGNWWTWQIELQPFANGAKDEPMGQPT